MALPNFLQFGKSYSNKDINLSADKAAEVIDASQTSGSNIELGSGTTTLFGGDYDLITAGTGNDLVYSARGDALITGSGSDTFVFGVGSKPQAPGMIGSCVVDDSGTNGGNNNETIEISKLLFGSTAKEQTANLMKAISNADAKGLNADGSGLQNDGSRTLVIDPNGDKITFLSGDPLTANHFKLV